LEVYEYGFINWKTIILAFRNICVRGSDPCSILSILAAEIIVTLVLNSCFIKSDISHIIFTSVVLSLAVPNSLNR
jgi:hypothetical protein